MPQTHDTGANIPDDPNRLTLGRLVGPHYDKSYKTLRSIAQVVLGPYYDELKQFYLDVFQAEEYQYIVYVARRSIGLAELFSIILWHEHNDRDFQCRLEANWAISTSDSTIMSYAAQIAGKLRAGLCPKILIVDDLLVQGNGMNELLSTIESNVIRELRTAGITADVDKYWQDIVNAINIRVFSQNSKVSMVNLQYQLRLKPKYRMTPAEWHDLSRRISGVILFSGMANATFIMGAESLVGIIDKKLLTSGIPLNEHSALLPVSERCDTFHERHYFGWADPRQPDSKYYCSLRIIKNQFAPSYLLLPFIFLPQLTERSYDLLKKKVFGKWGLDSSSCTFLCEDGQTSRLEYESMILHLSESLLMSWTQLAGITLTQDQYIPTKIALNYGINSHAPLMSKDVFYRLTDPAYLFTWPELQELLDTVTEDAHALTSLQSAADPQPQAIRKKLEDNIYMTKLQELAESFRCSQSLPPDHKQVLGFSLRQNKQTNWNIFLDEFNASIFKHIPGISADTLFRHLLESMDFGIVTLKARQNATRFAQVLRMSEQSLFIHPQRYSNYYPMLFYLDERRLRLGTDLESELRIFLNHEQSKGILSKSTDVDTLTTELTQYLKNLQKSGQDLVDWDIGFEKCLILDLNSVQADPKMRRLYSQERLAYMEATRIRRTLYNDCHAFYPL